MYEYDYDYYSGVDLEFPKKSKYITNFYYSAGKVLSREYMEKILNNTKFDYTAPKENMSQAFLNFMHNENIVMQTIIDMEAYNQAVEEYQSVLSKRELEFKLKLAEEYGLPEKVGEAVYGQAYSRGHAHGLSNIASVYGDLAELAKSVMDITMESYLKENGKICLDIAY